MDPLQNVVPTAEQMQLLAQPHPMTRIIRGAAGSGKTTTALLMLKLAITYHKSLRRRAHDAKTPVSALVFTFNTTLSSYIRQLATQMGEGIEIEVSTLARHCKRLYPNIRNLTIVDNIKDSGFIISDHFGLGMDYIYDEIDYILGRFQELNIYDYLDATRVGRGSKPRIDRAIREKIIDEIIIPYQNYKSSQNLVDWNDINQYPINNISEKYDIVIADETQDFSANELRCIVSMLHGQSHGTFVIDTVQKIYNRGFTWREVGLDIRPQNSFRLSNNYRNTIEIAQFAYQIMKKIGIDDDGTIPNYSTCTSSGHLPTLIEGLFSEQISHAINYIKNNINIETETVCFMNKSSGIQGYLKSRLSKSGLEYSDLTRINDWPSIQTNVVVSTMHSSKGLEFDHVFLLGLSNEFLNYEEDIESESFLNICRLLTVSITRAKKSVTLGYKKDDKPSILNLLTPSTYNQVVL